MSALTGTCIGIPRIDQKIAWVCVFEEMGARNLYWRCTKQVTGKDRCRDSVFIDPDKGYIITVRPLNTCTGGTQSDPGNRRYLGKVELPSHPAFFSHVKRV
jgi:hypothetical protein